MLRLIGRRLLLSIPLLYVVATATFMLVALLPGDVARSVLGQYATQQQYEQVRRALGVDQPLLTRYWHWLDHAVHGNLGTSPIYGTSVTSLLDSRLPVTLSLVVGATVVAAVVGIGLGAAGALQRGAVGRALDALALVGLAVPNFFLGLLLVAWLAVSVRLLPATGYVPLATAPVEWLKSLVLPVITLAVPGVAVIAKQTRDSMLDLLAQPFVRSLRASGIPRRRIVFKYVLRSAAISIATVVGLVFVAALSGTVVVESVFALPGLGGLAVQATEKHDVPVIEGVVVYFTIIVIAVNLVVDLAYGALDARVRAA